jgi:electron transfer flavoprotein beta subunit
VVSVEGATARLRRASLPGVVAARTAAVEVVAAAGPRPPGAPAAPVVRSGPYRPRARRRPSPSAADPHARILALTGATADRTPPVLVHLDPTAAAERILDQLRQWGYDLPSAPAGPDHPAG